MRSPILGFVGAVRSPKTGLAGNRKPGLGDLTGCGREQLGVVGRKGERERNRKGQKGQEKEKTPAGTEAFSGKISIQSPGLSALELEAKAISGLRRDASADGRLGRRYRLSCKYPA